MIDIVRQQKSSVVWEMCFEQEKLTWLWSSLIDLSMRVAGREDRVETKFSAKSALLHPDIIATTQLDPPMNIHQYRISGAVACLIHDTFRYRRDQEENYISWISCRSALTFQTSPQAPHAMSGITLSLQGN